jgi:hypothetical protein
VIIWAFTKFLVPVPTLRLNVAVIFIMVIVDRQTLFRESEFVLRTKATHNTDVGKSPDLMKETGLTSHTSLAGSQTFSIPENVCPDAMHDILEGCLQYELKLVLHYLITVDDDVSLSLDNFNSRMKLLCYGVDDKN